MKNPEIQDLPFSRFVGWTLSVALGGVICYLGLCLLIDPFNIIHEVGPQRYLTGDVRISKRGLARAGRNDSYFGGCSMSEEFSVPEFNRFFHADVGNLTMGSATSYEQWKILKQLPPKRFKVLLMEVYYKSYLEEDPDSREARFPAELYDAHPLNDVRVYLQLNPGILRELYAAYYWNRYAVDKDPGAHRVDINGYYGWEALKTWDASRVRQNVERARELKGRPLKLSADNLEKILAEAVPRFEQVLLYIPPVHAELLEAQILDASSGNQAAYLTWKRAIIRIAARHPNVVLLDYQRVNDYTRKDENYWDYSHFRSNLRQMILEDFASYLRTGRLSHPDFGHVADAAYGDRLTVSPS